MLNIKNLFNIKCYIELIYIEKNFAAFVQSLKKKHPDWKVNFHKTYFAKTDGSVLARDYKNHHNIQELTILFEDTCRHSALGFQLCCIRECMKMASNRLILTSAVFQIVARTSGRRAEDEERRKTLCFSLFLFRAPSCRKRRAAGGGAAPRGRLGPAHRAALLPQHAGSDGGKGEDGRSVRCPAGRRRLLQHPAPPHREDLRRRAGTQRGVVVVC